MLRTVFLMFIGLPLLVQPAYAESIPLMIPHSGTVASKGAPFNGEGRFRFAIINGHADCQTLPPPTTTNCVSAWSNDGTSTKGAMPGQAIKIPVSNGQFSLKLGDTSRKNEDGVLAMPTLGVGVFNSAATYLRVWFDDGQNGPQLLAPDRQLVAVPYAYRAQVAEEVTGTNGILSINGQGHFSRDAMRECCSPADPVSGSGLQDFTLSLGESTRNNDASINTGRRATLQFHNGGEAEGFIRLADGSASQPMLAPGTPAPRSLPLTSRRFIFGSYQSPMSGEFTGNVYAGAGSALIAYEAAGTRHARLLHTNNGNLHMDPIGGGNSYINWYGGGSLHIGNGSAVYGSILASDFTVASSRRLKTDISENRYGLAEVLKLTPVNYLYLNDPTNRSHIGLIAEDVDTIIPEIVQKNEQGEPNGIDYGKLTVVLINAVKELKQQNEALWREINALRQTQ